MDANRINLLLNILTVLIGGGALGIVLKYRLGTKKLTLDSEEAIRDHYAKEVARLTEKLEAETKNFRETIQAMEAHYRRMLEDSDRRHEECQRDRESLRAEVRKLERHVEGLEAQIRNYSTDRLLMLESRAPPSESAPHSLAAAKRLKENGDK